MIRKANEKDYDKINELGKIITDSFHEDNIINNPLKLVYVYEVDNVVIAFVIFNNLEEMELLNIAVNKNYQNKGIAFKLLEYSFNTENKKCFLEVNVNNLNAIKLYEKVNFKIISTRKKYYGNDDAYIMMRDKK